MSRKQDKLRVAIVGAHGSGKTTIAYKVVALLKARDIRVQLCRETARESHYISAGLREPEMQLDVFARQLSAEMEAARTADVVVCDRSLLDIFLYTRMFFGAEQDPTVQAFLRGMGSFVDAYMPTYGMLFRTTKLYSLTKTRDDARPKEQSFQDDYHNQLKQELERRNIEFIDLPEYDAADALVSALCQRIGLRRSRE